MTNDQKRTFWQHHIERWQQSGLSQKEYCKQHELTFSSFGYWRARLNRSKRAKKLIPVDIKTTDHARLSLPNGIRLEVPVHSLAVILPLLTQSIQENS